MNTMKSVALWTGASLVALASLAGGVLFLLGHGSVDVGGRPMEVGVGVTLIAAAGGTVAGLWRMRRATSDGGAFLAAGALPIGICFWWTGVAPVLAGSVAIAGLVRSRRAAKAARVMR